MSLLPDRMTNWSVPPSFLKNRSANQDCQPAARGKDISVARRVLILVGTRRGPFEPGTATKNHQAKASQADGYTFPRGVRVAKKLQLW